MDALEELLHEKLDFLKRELVVASDAAQKFTLKKQIEDVERQLAEVPDRAVRPWDENELIAKVEGRWLEGYLAADRDGLEPITVRRRLTDWARGREESVLPETSTFAVLNEHEHELLILGGIGSGKTTELLRLARRAVLEARQDPKKTIPVVLRLSRWDATADSFAEWLLGQLDVVYHVRSKSCRSWVENGELMLLIDQLDHVGLPERDRCIGLINAYLREPGHRGVVVCCRDESYRRGSVDLDLAATLELLPLADDQVGHALEVAGLAALRAAVDAHPAWRQVLSAPLFLSAAVRALRGVAAERLRGPWGSPAEVRRFLLDAYVDDAFTRAEESPGGVSYEPYTRQQMITWLRGLARRLTSQADFYLEEIQPRWLDRTADRWLYTMTSRILPGLLIGLSSLEAAGRVLGVLTGLGVGLLDAWRCEPGSRVAGLLARGRYVRLCCLAAGAVAVLAWLVTLPFWNDAQYADLYLAATLAAFFTWRGWRRTPDGDIQPVDTLRLNRSGAFWGVGPGVAFIVYSWWSEGSITSVFRTAMIGVPLVLTGAMVGGLLAGVLFGGPGGAAEERPNRRILQSVRSGFFAGLLVLLVPVLYALLSAVTGSESVREDFQLYLVLVAPVAVLMALLCGGADAMQHYLLRWILCGRGYLPWRLERFLDKAAEIVLRKAGPAYTFLHADFRDHFGRSNVP